MKYLALLIFVKIVSCKKKNMTIEFLYDDIENPKDRLSLFDFNDEVQNYETISINLPDSSESSDTKISFSFTAFGKNIKLNLNKTNFFIVNSNTLIYNLTRKVDDRLLCHKIPLKISPLEGFYEDKNNSALIYISVDANGVKRIEAGIIKAQNITIQRISKYLFFPDGRISNTSKSNEYIIQNTVNTSNNYSVLSPIEILNTDSPFSIVPHDLSIKVLLLVDNNFLNKTNNFEGGFNTAIKYLINFWSRVSMTFHNLNTPEYRIMIAGIVVDYDNRVFDFLVKSSRIEWGGIVKALKYEDAFNEMGKWLARESLSCIPIKSYSIAITHSPLLHDCMINFNGSCMSFSKWSVIKEATSCFVEHILHIPQLTKIKNIGLLFDDRFFNSVETAANQIATSLGIFTNEDSCHKLNNTQKSVATVRPSQNKWTECTLKSFKAFFKTYPTCLYDVSK